MCASAGGRRLLRRWICRPLQSVAAIDRRLDAVDELLERPGVASAMRAALRGPDLERCLGQVAAALAPPSEALPPDLAAAAQRRRDAAALLCPTTPTAVLISPALLMSRKAHKKKRHSRSEG